MNTDAIKRFLTALSSTVEIKRGQLYQLIQSAEASYCLRDINAQHEIGLALQSFAYPFNQVGRYYESVFLYRIGQFDKARELLESVAESAPSRYRSKALLSLSAVEESLGRFEESLRLRLTVTGDDAVSLIEAQRGIAVLRALEGDHRAALRELERLAPLAQLIGKRGHPSYFAFLNSYALELSESGRDRDAQQVADVIAACPYINRYGEWKETLQAVGSQRKNRSTVAVALPGVPTKKKPSDPRLQLAIDFIDSNLQRKISLSDLANITKLGEAQITRLFKAHFGTTPIDYVILLKLQKARELLNDHSLRIKEIMSLAGFSTKSNFAHHFKKHFKFSPTQYRKRILQKIVTS